MLNVFKVYETEAGALVNVDAALRRARAAACKVCERPGASLRCYKLDCENREANYHLACARSCNAKFGCDKNFFCPHHDVRPEICVERFDTLRRIYIEREENALLAKIFNHSHSTDMMMRGRLKRRQRQRRTAHVALFAVGSLIFHQLGQLLPEQLKTFHNVDHIFPVSGDEECRCESDADRLQIGYRITRLFWSPCSVNERARYECSIADDEQRPMFHVTLVAQTRDATTTTTTTQNRDFADRTMAGAWQRILAHVQTLREKHPDLLRLYPPLMNAPALFGLVEVSGDGTGDAHNRCAACL